MYKSPYKSLSLNACYLSRIKNKSAYETMHPFLPPSMRKKSPLRFHFKYWGTFPIVKHSLSHSQHEGLLPSCIDLSMMGNKDSCPSVHVYGSYWVLQNS